MNFLKNIVKATIFLGMVVTMNLQAKMVQFQEDAYAEQAPEKLISLVEKAAKELDFTSDYEVVVPKKAGIEINPWNKFAGYTINPTTKNSLIIINPEWFNQFPEDQQLFLIGRNLLLLMNGVKPFSFTVIQYSFIVISFLLLLLLIWILGKTVLKDQKIWVRIIAACIIIAIGEYCIFDPLEIKLKRYYGMQYDQKMHELALEKLSSKEAAIKALQYFDTSIKNEIKNGDIFFAPYENYFETYAENLRKS